MTWDEVCAHLRRTYVLDLDQDETFGLVWRFESMPTPVLQRQRVQLTVAFGVEPWVAISCPVAVEDQFPARAALAHNSSLALGALMLDKNLVVLRFVTALAPLEAHELDETLVTLANEAARLYLKYSSAHLAFAE